MAAMTFVCCLIAFLIGGIPFGYLIGRAILKDDIRRHGSGNIGATNVARVIGWKWGSLVLLLDAIKGFVPTLMAALWVKQQSTSDSSLLVMIATGVSAILGHMYPVYLKLRGGKGVATALGVVLVISPQASAVALILFIVVVAITRIVALASIAAAVGFSVTQLMMLGSSALDATKLPLTLFSVIVPALIVWRHRSNITRMIRGEENRVSSTKKTVLLLPDTNQAASHEDEPATVPPRS